MRHALFLILGGGVLNCPRWSSAARVKSGILIDRQRDTCKECQYLYTVSHKSDTSTSAQRRLAVTLYLEGLGFRSTGR